jgi:toxin FitB
VKFLVDVNVLSEGTKSSPSPAALDWIVAHRGLLTVNPIILGELEFGIRAMPTGKRKTQLRHWLEGSARNLPLLVIDADTALVWAELLIELKNKGRAMPVKDSLIAATARQHGLTARAHHRHSERQRLSLCWSTTREPI